LYDNESKGIGVGLQNIKFIRKGEPLSGRSSAADDFADDVDLDEDFNNESAGEDSFLD